MSNERRRSKLRIVLRFGVSALLIALVLTQVDLAHVGDVMAGTNPAWIGVAFLIYFGGYLISVARWRTLLAAHEVRPGFGYLYASLMIGMFFNQLLPTTVGGDVARYHYTSGGGRGAALSALVLDRLFGAVSLMLFAAVGLVVASRESSLPGALLKVVAAALVLGLVAIAVAFMWPQSGLNRLQRLSSSLPRPIAAVLEKSFEAFAAFRSRHDVAFAALLWSLLLQCVVIAHYYLAGLAIGLTIPGQAYVFIVPLAIAIMTLPISINGIGVRESVFVYFFGLYGADPAASVAFAFVIYAMVLGQGLLGGLVFALVRARQHGGATRFSSDAK